MTVQVHILLGGLVSWDGYVTSAGMFGLAKQLRALPGVSVTTSTWGSWQNVYSAITHRTVGPTKVVVIGYSGGGTRATWLANYSSKPRIDLMVLYDPSPKWQMQVIDTNVKSALCYYNANPMMPSFNGMLGGGRLVGKTKIETFTISEQHLAVQFDQSLHARTLAAVKQIV
jgi:hypothetical protein